jgi:hypothetical protein
MNSTERLELLNDLKSGKLAIANALAGVTEEMARRKPGPEKWSTLECMEHLAAAETYMLTKTKEAVRVAEPRINSVRERAIRERGADRTRRVESPEVAKPVGRFSTLEKAAEAFNTARNQAIDFVEGCEDDLRARITEHPLIGPVNCYENLLIMAAHPLRHAKQLQEIREAFASSAVSTALDS